MNPGAMLERVSKFKADKDLISAEIKKVIVGQSEVIDQVLMALFCRGHCLVVGVPGLAKTLLVKTVAGCLDLLFKRIQFTPDLMPADILGTEVIEEDFSTRRRSFRFIKGPLFTNVLLADEINRTPPKTQAALLEAMQEYRVTVGGETFSLPDPFFVLATQNPIEQEGTYPLPEAQLDRFMFQISIDYPKKDEEAAIISAATGEEMEKVAKILNAEQILALQQIVRRVPVSEHVVNYARDLIRRTRPTDVEAPSFIREWVSWGAGPRAGQYLILAAKARTVMRGDFNVSCNDVRAGAHPVLRHRIFTNFNADAAGVNADTIIERLLESTPESS